MHNHVFVNKMTESRIHELILEISDATTTKTGLNRDDKGLVKEISKTLANLIYSNLEDANKSNRLQLLVSLSLEKLLNYKMKTLFIDVATKVVFTKTNKL